MELGEESLDALRRQLEEIVRRVCPIWLSSQADDLVQASWLRIWDLVRREGKADYGSSYIRRVAHSVLVDEIRRQRRRHEVALQEFGPEPESSRTQTPQIQIESLDAGRAIRDCLRGFGQSTRRALTLYLLGHSVSEGSRLLGWSHKKTENLVYRGLARLRLCLREKGVRP